MDSEESPTFHWQVDAPWRDAEESLLRVAPNARIASGGDLRHRLQIDGDARFSLLHFGLTGEYSAFSEPDDSVTISALRSGWMNWSIGDVRGTGSSPWMQSPTQRTSSSFGDLDEVVLFLKKDHLTELARALYGDDELRLEFDGATPRDDGWGRYLAGLLDYAQAVASTDAFDQPLLRTALYRQLAVAVLEGYRLRGDPTERATTAQGRVRRYRLAVQFIDDHTSRAITPEDIAAAVEVSTAELERIFRGHSPSGNGVRRYVSRARLSAAHDELRATSHSGPGTVGRIAHRWGWVSVAAFRRDYRAAYGRVPDAEVDG